MKLKYSFLAKRAKIATVLEHERKRKQWLRIIANGVYQSALAIAEENSLLRYINIDIRKR